MGKPAYSRTPPYVRSKAIVKLRKELAERRMAIRRAKKRMVASISSQAPGAILRN